ncbi:MAG: hypothetical protein AAFV49_08175 [Pseudomonadota bacterium]
MNIGTVFEGSRERFQPLWAEEKSTSAQHELDQHKLAFMVGVVALMLPIILYISTLYQVCFYYSISHFYYSRSMGTVFTGALAFIGAFLIAYRGEILVERVGAKIAAVAAFGVAYFPTAGKGCSESELVGRPFAEISGTLPDIALQAPDGGGYFALFPAAANFHYISAALLFGFLAFYCFVVFTRVVPEEHENADGTLKPNKRRRNVLYYASGIAIVISMLAMGAEGFFGEKTPAGAPPSFWDRNNLTFWFEALALWAFGISWMVRGRFYNLAFLDDREKRTIAQG